MDCPPTNLVPKHSSLYNNFSRHSVPLTGNSEELLRLHAKVFSNKLTRRENQEWKSNQYFKGKLFGYKQIKNISQKISEGIEKPLNKFKMWSLLRLYYKRPTVKWQVLGHVIQFCWKNFILPKSIAESLFHPSKNLVHICNYGSIW